MKVKQSADLKQTLAARANRAVNNNGVKFYKSHIRDIEFIGYTDVPEYSMTWNNYEFAHKGDRYRLTMFKADDFEGRDPGDALIRFKLDRV